MFNVKGFNKRQILGDKATLGSFAVMLALLLVFTTHNYTSLYNKSGFDEHAYVELTKAWVHVLPDGREVPIAELPVDLGDKAGEEVVVRRRLPSLFLSNNPVMFVKSSHQLLAVRIDGEEVYRYDYYSFNAYDADYPPTQWIVVPLDGNYHGKMLELSLTRMQDDPSDTLSRVYVGEKSDIIFALIRRSLFPLMCGFVPLLIGIFFIFRHLFIPARKELGYRNLYIGFVLVLLPLWLICNSEIKQLFFGNLPYIRNLEFLSLMLLPAPVILSVNYSENEKYDTVARCLCTAIFLVDIIIMLRTLWGGHNLPGQLWLVLLTMAAAIAFIVISFWRIAVTDAELFRSLRGAMLSYGMLALFSIAEYLGLTFSNGRHQGVSLAVGVMVYSIGVSIGQFRSQRKLVTQAQQAELENRAKSDFLANMSHEIRTPINAVLGMDEMILREATEPNVLRYAADIRLAGRHLLTIINDILDIARIEAGRMELTEAGYEVSDLMLDAIDLIQAQADDKNLAFEANISPEANDLRLYGDAPRIRQIAVNLLSNAVKYTKSGRVVLTVDTVSEEEANVLRSMAILKGPMTDIPSPVYLRISVRDTGIGIRQDDISALFDRFNRLDQTQNAGIQGTGLGLSIVSTLVDLMHGCLLVESVYGVGTQFVVVLPQRDASDEAVLDAATAHKKTGDRALFLAPEAEVLAVDDNSLNRRLLEALLRRTQVRLTVCESGADCLELVRGHHYDLILMDHLMPEMDGIETLHRMRRMSDNKSAGVPVIVLTANAIVGVREQYLAAGFDDYLSKPLQSAELEEMMQRYLPPEKLRSVSEEADGAAEAGEEVPEWLRRIDELDVGRGISFCSSAEIYLDTLGVYAKTSADNADEIERYYGAGDIANATVKIHALKSTSRAVGAVELSKLAERLELAGNEGDAQTLSAEIGGLLRRYRALGEQLLEHLDASTEEERPLTEISDKQLHETYDMIRELAEGFQLERAASMIGFLEGCRLPEEERGRVERLKHAADNFDWDQIGDILA